MKKYLICSIIKGGILGGCLIATDEKLNYKTNKLTVDPEIKNIEINYKDIKRIEKGGLLIFKTYKFILTDNREYKFLVFTLNALDTLLKSKVDIGVFNL